MYLLNTCTGRNLDGGVGGCGWEEAARIFVMAMVRVVELTKARRMQFEQTKRSIERSYSSMQKWLEAANSSPNTESFLSDTIEHVHKTLDSNALA